MIGRINSFQSLGTVDGPGIRTVVFLQGCSLRCPYCHNPDTWSKTGGTLVTSYEIAEKVLRYKGYFGSEGGITVSGGEPLLQAEFVKEVFTLLHNEGVSTALDTAGSIINDEVVALIKVTDIVLLDIKFSSNEKYKKHIGISLEDVLRFLEVCEKMQKRVIVRQVITPTVNDNVSDVLALKNIVSGYKCVEKIELLPFHKLCLEKYESLNINFPFGKYEEMNQNKLEELQEILNC